MWFKRAGMTDPVKSHFLFSGQVMGKGDSTIKNQKITTFDIQEYSKKQNNSGLNAYRSRGSHYERRNNVAPYAISHGVLERIDINVPVFRGYADGGASTIS